MKIKKLFEYTDNQSIINLGQEVKFAFCLKLFHMLLNIWQYYSPLKSLFQL